MLIDLKTACERLTKHDNILIFAHQKPDGDTLGAAFALLRALLSLGKRARVECADGFPDKYDFIVKGYAPDKSFEPEYVVAVDAASRELLGPKDTKYADNVDLCIDHHMSNTMYAKETLLGTKEAAACEIIYGVITELNTPIGSETADAIFTGITTDTGCFKYSNVTAKTHIIAAKMIEAGADHAKINKLLFDTKSQGMLMVDRMMIETTAFYFNGLCALSVLPGDICEAYGVTEEDLDGVASFPVRIRGVLAGVTVRAKKDGTYRVSMRTVSPVDASRMCANFGGGGHLNAAGCSMSGKISDVTEKILGVVKDELARYGYA